MSIHSHVFNNTPCICYNQGKNNERKRFWFGVTISFWIALRSNFFFVLKIAQLSFKWADVCSWEDARLTRLDGGQLVTFSLDENSGIEIITTCVIQATVYNSLHKRLKSRSVIIDVNVLYLHIIPARHCRRLRGENLTGATSVFPHGGSSVSSLTHIGLRCTLIYSIVYCAFCLN